MSQETETFEIILGRVEHINASHFNCLSFAKASDMVNGINLRLSNMAGGYPFSFGGVTWRDSETLYLCGEFSDSSEKHLLVQEDMQRQVALQLNVLSRKETIISSAKILPISAYNGCSTLYGRSVWVMPTLQIYS